MRFLITDPISSPMKTAPIAMRSEYKRPASVLVVVFTRAGEYLLMRRIQPQQFWQSVTGSLRPGENPRHAALRELREETGLLGAAHLINLHQSRLFPIVQAWRHRYAKQHHFNREYWFGICLPTRRVIRLNQAEHSEYRWLHLDRALALASSWTNRAALRLLAAFIANSLPMIGAAEPTV